MRELRRSSRLGAVLPVDETSRNTGRHRKHRVSPQPAPECIGGGFKAARGDNEQQLAIESLHEDIIQRIASFLTTNHHPSPLIALAKTAKLFHTTLRDLVDAERRALADAACKKLRMDEVEIAAKTELYCQGRALTDAEGVPAWSNAPQGRASRSVPALLRAPLVALGGSQIR